MFKKSSKQRRAEIKAKRLEKARKAEGRVDTFSPNIPENAVAANHAALEHINSYAPLPFFYVDRPFICRDCGIEQLWTAKQQKWWYEIAKGHIDSVAVRCRPCRNLLQDQKNEARRIHLEGLEKKRTTGAVEP